MTTQPKSVRISTASLTVRKSNPRLRTIRDPWIRRALAVHSASTR